VAENTRPPVAVRIVRPYDTEDALLENELETFGKTSVLLIGAHPRATGIILRFEMTLASGATVLRGEGRVLAHKENAFRGQPGLSLRFTRLDPRSKSLVDRATAMREARSRAEEAPPPAPSDAALEAAVESAPEAANELPRESAVEPTVPEPSRVDVDLAKLAPSVDVDLSGLVSEAEPATEPAAEPEPERPPVVTLAQRPLDLTPPPLPVATSGVATSGLATSGLATTGLAASAASPGVAKSAASSGTAGAGAGSERGALAAPADRAELLARLRERATRLAPERVESILASAPRRS